MATVNDLRRLSEYYNVSLPTSLYAAPVAVPESTGGRRRGKRDLPSVESAEAAVAQTPEPQPAPQPQPEPELPPEPVAEQRQPMPPPVPPRPRPRIRGGSESWEDSE